MRAAVRETRAAGRGRDSAGQDPTHSPRAGRRTPPGSVRRAPRSAPRFAAASPSSGRMPGRAAARSRGSSRSCRRTRARRRARSRRTRARPRPRARAAHGHARGSRAVCSLVEVNRALTPDYLFAMKRAGVVLAGLLAAAAVASAALPQPARSRIQDDGFHSAGISETLHYEVYLPADYWTSTRRYPVVYFLHGLPSGAKAYESLGFVERALDGTGRAASLVVPQGARYDESDPEYVDHAPGDRWETAIGTELPAVVDERYRTIGTRTGRAIVGLSAGGFGAMHIGIDHLDRFAAIESWSGYFHPTDPTGTKPLALGPADDVHDQIRATR